MQAVGVGEATLGGSRHQCLRLWPRSSAALTWGVIAPVSPVRRLRSRVTRESGRAGLALKIGPQYQILCPAFVPLLWFYK